MSTAAAAPIRTTATAADAADADARKESAATLLGLVLGEGVVAALHEGFLKGGDFTAVVPLLVGAGGKPYLAAATRAALATACDAGLAGVASLLLEADSVRAEDADAESAHVDENGVDGYTLLAAAADRGDAGVVRALVDSGKADVNAMCRKGKFPLLRAACGGHSACLDILLAAPGIDVNKHDGYDCALTAAAQHGRAECVIALLAADGIDVNQTDDAGECAVVLAASEGHAACVRALVAAPGIDINQASGADCALTCAAEHGRAECISALLAADGIDVNQPDYFGQSALALAAEQGHAACVRALLAAKGVDHSIVDTDQSCKTALHHACAGKNAEMALLLLVAGSCRFALCRAKQGAGVPLTETPLALAGDDKAVRAVFLSGVDYWQRRRHGGHSWEMHQVVLAIMLARQRLDAAPPPTLFARVCGARALVHLPEEIWLLMCGFLRSADFGPR